ncbi:hypothetical protein M8C17_06280 [Micromonospora sp. RHAY321]|uniref:hypothetical protein n=1 Tax=Micromonospora sp. RHAY321 TaxID=2944807 RepID=UPI00207D6BA2|nr:hypothetical protein [Micromonospora sp. RHAY321]MCO1594771.1 hypothetical protein [Micromonospora sp. RHAY321]
MRRSLGDGWSIELIGPWTRERATHGAATWRAPGRLVHVAPGAEWRCANGVDIIASLDAELPPDPAGKLAESGRDGVGHRAAWLYHRSGDAAFALYGYTFRDDAYVETFFTSPDAADPGWAFDAWRSVAHSTD